MTGQPRVTRVTVRADLDDGTVIEISGTAAEVLIDRERPVAGIAFDDQGVPELPMERDVYSVRVTGQNGLLQVRRLEQENHDG